ncbi:MAG TPA: Clp protease N-terminal domain-containing protein [Acidimicrobiia bacterium]|nr:Clp protease N-terminal domain-containing protein [Acidimicrobiia bacterium]
MRPPLELEQLVDLVEDNAPNGTRLDHLTEAVRVADGVNVMADQLIGHFVDRARDSGASWAEIGRALGVSKQAVQKRFVARRVPRESKGLFTRFDAEARSVAMAAMEQARGAGHDHIQTGHVVLALIEDPGGLPAITIESQGVALEQVRESMHAILGPAQDPVSGHLPFTADAKKVLELSLREAIRTRSRVIRPEHILLGVLRDQKSPTAMCLAGLGVDRKKIERAIPDAVGE